MLIYGDKCRKYVLGICGHMVLGHEDHFPVEDLISENEVAEQTNVAVGQVEWLLHDDVGVGADDSVEGVVLQMGGVKMCTCVFIDSELSDESGEVVHGEEVSVVPGGG
jgi:hypothetical protein